jgi:NAD(P)-dependent dehydrogenase (short-subunit alcohol dehydrogenase family)
MDEVDLVFYLTRSAWPQLKASRGVVVNMASPNGSLSFRNLPARGIRVNSISPGSYVTGIDLVVDGGMKVW